MPNLDKTGPRGEGPMTGWKMGLCGRKDKDTQEKETKDDVLYGLGRGGRPYGGGRGWCWAGGRRRRLSRGPGRFRGGWGHGRKRFEEE